MRDQKCIYAYKLIKFWFCFNLNGFAAKIKWKMNHLYIGSLWNLTRVVALLHHQEMIVRFHIPMCIGNPNSTHSFDERYKYKCLGSMGPIRGSYLLKWKMFHIFLVWKMQVNRNNGKHVLRTFNRKVELNE